MKLSTVSWPLLMGTSCLAAPASPHFTSNPPASSVDFPEHYNDHTMVMSRPEANPKSALQLVPCVGNTENGPFYPCAKGGSHRDPVDFEEVRREASTRGFPGPVGPVIVSEEKASKVMAQPTPPPTTMSVDHYNAHMPVVPSKVEREAAQSVSVDHYNAHMPVMPSKVATQVVDKVDHYNAHMPVMPSKAATQVVDEVDHYNAHMPYIPSHSPTPHVEKRVQKILLEAVEKAMHGPLSDSHLLLYHLLPSNTTRTTLSPRNGGKGGKSHDPSLAQWPDNALRPQKGEGKGNYAKGEEGPTVGDAAGCCWPAYRGDPGGCSEDVRFCKAHYGSREVDEQERKMYHKCKFHLFWEKTLICAMKHGDGY